ncbi:unnamed protein product [Dovyalis caffra]|uniref:Uncharacterized protein n=1 Tax=Dovyalis caffra TaxID=77055 RepID=A0AAV1RGH0_9ROSI|nr:unnamed protein product [Dovyalis caffra]
MDSRQEILGHNSSEDIRWLCNLSESELDMLIRLKSLILHRATVIGQDELAKNFDLPTLRAIGKVKDLSHVQGLTKLAAFPECCNLLKGNTGDNSSIEELKACIGIDERKRPTKRGNQTEETEIMTLCKPIEGSQLVNSSLTNFLEEADASDDVIASHEKVVNYFPTQVDILWFNKIKDNGEPLLSNFCRQERETTDH